MRMIKTLETFAYSMAMMPTSDDWQMKIDKVVDEYFNETIHLPRKQKKKRRKELNADYRFYIALKDYNPFKYKF